MEAFTLLHSIYRGLPDGNVADLVDRPVGEIRRARNSLVKKAAVALGYLSEAEAGITLRRVEDPLVKRRRQVKQLYEQGNVSMRQIGAKLGVSEKTVSNDLKAMGIEIKRSGWKLKPQL